MPAVIIVVFAHGHPPVYAAQELEWVGEKSVVADVETDFAARRCNRHRTVAFRTVDLETFRIVSQEKKLHAFLSDTWRRACRVQVPLRKLVQ